MKNQTSIVAWALWLSLLAPLLIIVGALGARLNAIPFDIAFGVLGTKAAGIVALGTTVLAIVAVAAALSNFKKLGATAIAALLISGVTLAGEARFFLKAQGAIPVHDVSTNWEDPLSFSNELMSQRLGAENLVEDDPRAPASAGPPWGGVRVADVNAKTCPGAKAVPHGVDPDKAVKALQANGYAVFGAQVFLVEGTHTGDWFGAADDIIVRIRPERTDVRSIRRNGLSDYGENCARVTRIVQALSK